MATRDNEMQRLKVRDVEEIGHARILGNAGNSARALSTCAGTSSSMVAGGSAAAANGKASSKSKVNPNSTNGHAIANEGGGTWSKSMTHTKDKNGTLSSRTKSMAHEPSGPPVKSTVGAGVSTSR